MEYIICDLEEFNKMLSIIEIFYLAMIARENERTKVQ